MRRLNTYDFINKAKEVHGDKYDYSKVEYKKSQIPVCIICPEHGEFWQTPYNHIIKKCNCPKCSNTHHYTTEEWILKAKEVHGDKYDYSKVDYKRRDEKICIICPEHGEFWQRPSDHISGQDCPKCMGDKISIKKRANENDIINRFKKIHGDKYDYSKVEYINMYTKVCIICTEHGEFWQKPITHLVGHGCPKCTNRKLNTNEWIEIFKKTHGDRYDYSKVEYKKSQIPVCIICPEHGEFWQKPVDHKIGKGCPICKSSKLELHIKQILEENNILYIKEHSFDWLRYDNPLKLDFFLPEYNIAIECQGLQHFKPIEYFGGENGYKKIINRDIKKIELCEEHNIKLIHFTDEQQYKEKWNIYKIIYDIEDLLKIIKNAKKV